MCLGVHVTLRVHVILSVHVPACNIECTRAYGIVTASHTAG